MTCKKECMEQKKDGTLKDCPIQKENEELKAQIERISVTNFSVIEKLKAQNKLTRMEKGVLEAKLKTYEILWDEQQKAIKEKSAQIEKMKCCGNCIHQYEGKIEDGVRCKDHYSDSVCKHWKYDEYTVQNRLYNEWS